MFTKSFAFTGEIQSSHGVENQMSTEPRHLVKIKNQINIYAEVINFFPFSPLTFNIKFG